MPIYEYRCENCEKVTDFLEGVGDGIIKKECKYCGSKQLKKILSASAVRVSSGGVIGSQNSKTCCGRNERCDMPPCSGGACIR